MSAHQPPWRYSMIIQWSDEDQAYIVTVPELEGCRTHGATYDEAVRQAQEAIEVWVEGAEAWGQPVPAPRLFADTEPARPAATVHGSRREGAG